MEALLFVQARVSSNSLFFVSSSPPRPTRQGRGHLSRTRCGRREVALIVESGPCGCASKPLPSVVREPSKAASGWNIEYLAKERRTSRRRSRVQECKRPVVGTPASRLCIAFFEYSESSSASLSSILTSEQVQHRQSGSKHPLSRHWTCYHHPTLQQPKGPSRMGF